MHYGGPFLVLCPFGLIDLTALSYRRLAALSLSLSLHNTDGIV